LLDKNCPSVVGIYYIQNTSNGLCYIGSSVHIKDRVRTHFSELLKGTHHSSKLQNAFNKYGVDAFVWGVCEEVLPDNSLLMEKEQTWIDELGHYNVCRVAGSPRGTPMVLSEEERKRRSDRAKKMVANLTQAQIANALERALEAKRGVPLTPSHRKKLSEATKGKKLTGVHLEKVIKAVKSRTYTEEEKLRNKKNIKKALSERTPEQIAKWKLRLSDSCKGRPSNMKGVKMSEESRKKMSVFHKGKVISDTQKEKIRQTMKSKGPEWYIERAEKIRASRARNKAAKIAAQ
jgi:group I intron endonuclease